MIAWNFQRIVGTCQFRVPWFGYPCGYSSLTMLLVLTLLFLVLLVPYIMHYYTLENEVQKMYTQYDEILKHLS